MRTYQLRQSLIAAGVSLVVSAQGPPQLMNLLTNLRLCLADLRNYSYTVVFPKRDLEQQYSGKSEYLYSVVSPSGRSLFAVRREFNRRGDQFDTLIKRALQTSDFGPEEVVSTPFSALFRFAVSANERFLVVAGRLQDPTLAKDKRDGIFLLDRSNGGVHPMRPYESLSQDIRSFNVSDAGDMVIYEDKESVMIFTGLAGRLMLAEHHLGKFPVLMPNGRAYIYSDRGQLVLNDGKVKRDLLGVRNLTGAIRISPDAQFVAFGVDLSGNLSQLKICELKALVCVDGPKYFDWIAGRETFWIKR